MAASTKEQIKALRKAGYTAEEAAVIVEGADEDGEDYEESPDPVPTERAAKLQADLRAQQKIPAGPDEPDPELEEVDSKVTFPQRGDREVGGPRRDPMASPDPEIVRRVAEKRVKDRIPPAKAADDGVTRYTMEPLKVEGTPPSLQEVDGGKASYFKATTDNKPDPAAEEGLSPERKAIREKAQAEYAARQRTELDRAGNAQQAKDLNEIAQLKAETESQEAWMVENKDDVTPEMEALQNRKFARIKQLEAQTSQFKPTGDAKPKSWFEAARDALGFKPSARKPEDAKPAEPKDDFSATPSDTPATEDRTGLGAALGGGGGGGSTKTKVSAKAGGSDAPDTTIKGNFTPNLTDNPLPEFAESKITIRNPDTGEVLTDGEGNPKQLTGQEAFQQYAEWRAAEIDKQTQEYKAEKDAAKAAGMWTEILRGIAALGMGMYGMKHGVDMSGYKFDPIDWVARQEAERRGYETGVASTREKYQALQDMAQGHTANDALDFNRRMAKFQAIEGKNAQEINRINADRQYALDQKRLSIESWRVGAEWEKIKQTGKKYGSMDPKIAKEIQTLEFKATTLLEKAMQNEAKNPDLAKAQVSSAKILASKLQKLNEVYKFNDKSYTDSAVWNQPAKPSKYHNLPVVGPMLDEDPRSKSGGEVLAGWPGTEGIEDASESDERRIVTNEYSKSRNQTRRVWSDGKVETLNGYHPN